MNSKATLVVSVIVFSVASAFVSASDAAGHRGRSANVSACGIPAPSAVQRRILQKSAQSSAALRDYVYITRGIHRLDYAESAQWAADYRARQAACHGA